MQQESEITQSSFGNNLSDLDNKEQPNHLSSKVTLILIIVGFYFIIFGIIELITNTDEKLDIFQLTCNSNLCKSQPIFISYDGNDNVEVYIKMNDINQHDIQNILKSDPQYQNNIFSSLHSDCQQFTTNQALNKTLSIDGTPLIPSNRAIPCGYFASMFPEGKFRITNMENNRDLNITTSLVRKQHLFNYGGDTDFNIDPSLQWIDLNDNRLQVWMDLTIPITVDKLWGVIKEKISGTYVASYQFESPHQKRTKFQIVLQNNKSLGGQNKSLVIVNFVFGCLMFLFSILSFILKNKYLNLSSKKVTNNHKLNQESINQRINNCIMNVSEDVQVVNGSNEDHIVETESIKSKVQNN